MGVRITDGDHVAIYDSVTGTAFGPVFGSEDEAQGFLDGLDMDARDYSPDELSVQHGRYVQWLEEAGRA